MAVSKRKGRRINEILLAYDLVPHDWLSQKGDDGLICHYSLNAIDIVAKLDTTGGIRHVHRGRFVKGKTCFYMEEVPVNTVNQRIRMHESRLHYREAARFFHLGAEAEPSVRICRPCGGSPGECLGHRDDCPHT